MKKGENAVGERVPVTPARRLKDGCGPTECGSDAEPLSSLQHPRPWQSLGIAPERVVFEPRERAAGVNWGRIGGDEEVIGPKCLR